MEDASTITSETPYEVADTVHITAVYRRPPFPYDAVASRVRLVQEPKKRGALITTVGVDGLSGASVITLIVVVTGFKSQVATGPEHKAFSVPPMSTTLSPIERSVLVATLVLVVTLKVTLTELALSQEQMVVEDPVKMNTKLQDQVFAVIPDAFG